MRERPILFSAPMVRAILAGQKTVTRRIVKPQPERVFEHMEGRIRVPDGWRWRECYGADDGGGFPEMLASNSRYGVAGDVLWVRETFRSWRDTCDQTDLDDEHECGEHCDQTYVAYAATPRQGYRPKPDKARITYLDKSTPLESNRRLLGPWKPGIHMPRWASRLTLAITAVRAERLHDLTIADAMAEGIPQLAGEAHDLGLVDLEREHGYEWDNRTSVENFARLWDHINAERAPWSSNPWVWAVTFEVIR